MNERRTHYPCQHFFSLLYEGSGEIKENQFEKKFHREVLSFMRCDLRELGYR